MSNSLKQKQYLKFLIEFLVLGSLFGVTFSVVLFRSYTWSVYLRGLGFGFIISFFSLIGNYTFLRSFRKLSFLIFVLIKSIYFTFIGVALTALRVIFIKNIPVGFDFKFGLYLSIQFSLIISIVFNLTLYIRRLLGPNIFRNFITGRYHKPKEEERIFMFLDLNNSTAIAEKNGHVEFHRFLNQFYYDISDLILATGGEIYKYVGDEVIIDWTPRIGLKNSRCIELYFNIVEKIKEKESNYIEKFDVIPKFKIALHAGKVIVGELGDFKREIAFLGDTVNTTKKIQESCKILNVNILLSSKLKDKLPNNNFVFNSLGEIQLKGKRNKIEVFTVSR